MSTDIFSQLDEQGDGSLDLGGAPEMGQDIVSNIDSMLDGDENDDDLFSTPQNTNAPPPQQQSNLDDMLANDDDDDLFANNNSTNAPAEPEQPSALTAWEAKKREELAQLDAGEAKQNDTLRDEAKVALDKHFATLRNAQELRAKHNLEVDQQTIADLESTINNKWEKTVSYIDFNRSDLHERDVSRMKSLLLQLKH
ncbi:hypothetical protein TRFO_36354 [Tritrichomonas foetus]|uniref:Clathrin light chain n=1 Tax=Tritrichomonas foetus TaxID=1144522 RepID=A0A1J4JJI0_9EUKA|nr:hypothetical protein TRFO_36354 [Tritrichomonas foetus]|eukprot:OHS97404.1 hypothetical protein TRFO_36354 [Tritrichomonas foetus]